MAEVFKFINVESGSKKSERALFFSKKFENNDNVKIEKWK